MNHSHHHSIFLKLIYAMKNDQAHFFNYKLSSGWYEGGGGWDTLSRTANIMFSTLFSAIVSRES